MLEAHASLERGGHVPASPFRLFDSDGDILVMRPDITLAIARMVATRVSKGELPLRLRYSAPVVREESTLAGQPRQFTQLGVELVGGEGIASETEVVSLLAEALKVLDVPAWTIVCGSVLPLTALLEAGAPSEEFRQEALRLVHVSDYVGLDELASSADVEPAFARALTAIPRLAGGIEVLDELDALLCAAGVPDHEAATSELRSLFAGLPALVEGGLLRLDFSVINSFDYYTGAIFKGYAEGITAAIASGGRYDAVLANQGLSDTAACGFMLSLERLQEVLGEQGESGVVAPKTALSEPSVPCASPCPRARSSRTRSGCSARRACPWASSPTWDAASSSVRRASST